jgi:hypothetical protein
MRGKAGKSTISEIVDNILSNPSVTHGAVCSPRQALIQVLVRFSQIIPVMQKVGGGVFGAGTL